MGERTGIEWCDHTFNPWWGCEKISPGCGRCYAATLAGRFGTEWGPDVPRRFFGEKHWNEPLAWNRAAQKAGVRARVFCASMADVFEGRRDLDSERRRLAALIRQTASLDWLLLTKRPENVMRLAGEAGMFDGGRFRPNVWMGVSVESQAFVVRAAELVSLPADVRFLSCEPLLGPVDLRPVLNIAWQCSGCRSYFAGRLQQTCPTCKREGYWSGAHAFNRPDRQTGSGISWVIVGGESGDKARPMHPEWSRSLRDQCSAAGVPYFFKQWGQWAPVYAASAVESSSDGTNERWLNVAGGHGFHGEDPWLMRSVGKKAAGSLLDGRAHKAFPEVSR